ncbi:hypothetical protein ARMGADRAFT_1105590 [Armillaria gallica]|uniref:Uncharacterized protein n=1 Tax=Armillaria gallica TaxID=47427 RepID=A0A2H3DMA5_ARMGA|nr:hypothetical protein ARMGADRAFT_1105590 [Armillaria gallica]
MFFRILALLPLVSLVTANCLVGRSDVGPVCNAPTTRLRQQSLCKMLAKTLRINLPRTRLIMSKNIYQFGITFEGQIQYGIVVCPTDVLSSSDTQLFFDALQDLYAAVQILISFIIELESLIETAGFKGEFCIAIKMMATSTTTFMDKAYDCSASEYQDQLSDMRKKVGTMMASVQVSYCGTISPNGSSEVSVRIMACGLAVSTPITCGLHMSQPRVSFELVLSQGVASKIGGKLAKSSQSPVRRSETPISVLNAESGNIEPVYGVDDFSNDHGRCLLIFNGYVWKDSALEERHLAPYLQEINLTDV